MDAVDCALERLKSQLSNAPQIKSISHLVDDVSSIEKRTKSDFSTFLVVFNYSFIFYNARLKKILLGTSIIFFSPKGSKSEPRPSESETITNS